MDHRHFESVKKVIATTSTEAAGTRKFFPIDVTRVADAGHNMMVDNPEGFLEAFWHIAKACEEETRHGMPDGQKFGQRAWMRERGVLTAMDSFFAGKEGKEDRQEEEEQLLVMEGRSKNPKGTRSDPYVWTKCQVMTDHGDGVYKIKWLEGDSAGLVSSKFGGHRLRTLVVEPAVESVK